MVANELNLLPFFHVYNEMYFDGILPIPSFRVSHSYKTLGYFHCQLDDIGNIIDPTIDVTDYYDFTEDQLRDVIVHEMIHYYLLYTYKDMECSHGKEFKKLSSKFNSTYDTNITETVNLSTLTLKEGKSKILSKLFTLF